MIEDPLSILRLTHFATLIGQTVSIDFGQGAVPATIVEARAIGGHTTRPDGGFSVTIQAAVGPRPQQGTFRVRHPELGDLDIFMSPRRLIGDLTVYEFIFN